MLVGRTAGLNRGPPDRGIIDSPRLNILLLAAALAVLILLCGVIYQFLGALRDRRRFPPPGRMIDIGGRRLHLVEAGQGSPAVIFEAGISATCLNWTRVRTEAGRFTRACAYDRASLGWSDPAPSPRVLPAIVDDLHALLLAARIQPPHLLVAHSFGALVVSAYASTYPSEVAGLILVDPLTPTEWRHPTEAQSRMLRRGVTLARRGALLTRVGLVRFSLAILAGGGRLIPKAIARMSSGEGESVISRLVGEVRKMPPDTWPMIQAHWCQPKSFEALGAYLESLPASSAEAAALQLPGTIPVVILSGSHSTPALLAQREELARRAAYGRHIVAERSAHWIHLDEPELVVQSIQEMLDQIRKV